MELLLHQMHSLIRNTSCFLLVLLSVVTTSANQELLEKKITIHVNNVSFQETLTQIEAIAGVRFVYSADQLRMVGKVSLHVDHQALGAVLNEFLLPKQIRYKLHGRDNVITLKRKSTSQAGVESDLIEAIEPISSPQYQEILVSGVVTESHTGNTLPGVNVVIKGTTNGTTTDAQGTYTLRAEENASLVFSFIGLTTVTTPIQGRSVINISMEEESSALQEVVVNAGYWQVSAKERTGSIAQLRADDIAKQPVQNPLAAMQGRIAGVDIIQQTGVPGGNFQVRIRGTNSLANGNDPLYIVDGVPFTSASLAMPETSLSILGQGTSPLNAINPADIERIEVLKDADATAIYGSRGSNGVILITTKRAKEGRTKLDVNMYSGFGHVTRHMGLLSSSQYTAMRKEAFAKDNVTPTLANARDLVAWDTTRYTDWQKELLGGTARTTDAQVGLSGGDANTQFSIRAGYHRESTVFPGNNEDTRMSLHTTWSNTAPNKKLKTSVAMTYTINNTTLLRQDLTARALTLPPVAPATWTESGNLSWENWSSSYENPMAILRRTYESTTGNLLANASVSYRIIPSLELRSTFGYTNLRMGALTVTPATSLAPDAAPLNSTAFASSRFENWIAEPQLAWTTSFGNSRLELLVGATFLDQETEGLGQTGSGFTSEALMKNIAAAPIRDVGTNYLAQYRYQALFGRINYNLAGKYILNITARRDGSSRFGPGRQFASFGAIGAAWIFSKENALSNALQFLTHGKLRVSIGSTGNDQLGDYQYLDTYSSSPSVYQGIIGLQPDRLSNRDFGWESNTKLEAALELELFDSRIATTLAVYRNRSSSQLVGFPLPATTGFASIQGNFPATVQNAGFEGELSAHIIRKGKLSWTSSFNISVPRNKLLEFPDIENFPAYANRYVVGQPLSISKLYHFTGVDPLTGMYTFLDVDGNGSFNIADRQSVHNIGLQYFGGLQNAITLGAVQVDFLFQFVKQTALDYPISFGAPGTLSNVPTFVLDRWQQAGDQTATQRFGQNAGVTTPYTRLLTSDHMVSDASFIRLKNFSCSYTLPQRWSSQARIDMARIYIIAQNLATFTRHRGLDPETQFNRLPPLRVISFGVQLTL